MSTRISTIEGVVQERRLPPYKEMNTMSWTRIKIMYYAIENFIKNIWKYRRFLRDDWPFQADGIMTMLEIKLADMKKNWEQPYRLRYIGEEKDLEDITIAYNALMDFNRLEEITTEELFSDIEGYKKKRDDAIDTLFNQLKKYQNWWT